MGDHDYSYVYRSSYDNAAYETPIETKPNEGYEVPFHTKKQFTGNTGNLFFQ